MKLARRILSTIVAAAIVLPASTAYADAVGEASAPQEPSSASLQSKAAKSALAASVKKVTLSKKGKYIYGYCKGKAVRSAWGKSGSKRYYFKKNGRAATGSLKIKGAYYVFSSKGVLASSSKPKITTVGSAKYVSGKDGKALSGWQVVSDRLYYASKTGKLSKSKTVDKIPLTSKYYAKTTSERTKLMKESLKIIARITNDKMTRFEKLEKCFNYSCRIKFRVTYYPATSDKDWQIKWANHTLEAGIANCYGFCCVFAGMAKALGEDPYLIYFKEDHDKHIFVELSGKYWDNSTRLKDTDKPCFDFSEETTTKVHFW